MTATAVSATLYVDGVRVADGAPGEDDAHTFALSGLALSWGRGTTVDQPEPSVCTFDVADPAGADSFLQLLYVGAEVTVRAAGLISAPPTLPINTDPGFELAPPGSVPPGWTIRFPGTVAEVTADHAALGAQSARITTAADADTGVNVSPAPTSADPAAWDDLPPMRPAEAWAVAAAVWAPPGAVVVLGVRRYTGPADLVGADLPAVSTNPGMGTWRALITTYTVPPGGNGWAGAFLQVTFPRWNAPGGADGITWDDYPGTWADAGAAYVDELRILAPSSADMVARDVTVYSGRITDLDAGWDDGVGAVVCSVTAADFTADLAGRDVSAEPWPVQRLDARFAAVLAGALPPSTVRYTIAPTLAAYPVTWMDVDRQQVLPLLQDLATSVDGILWSATHSSTGPYFELADPRTAAALYRLVLTDGVVTVQPTSTAAGAITVDADDVDLDPVTFRQAVSDVVTRVALTWAEQTVDDKGQPAPTDRTVTVIDAAAELELGTRRVAVTTVLTSAATANEVAELLLARLHLQSWRANGLVWRTDQSNLTPDRIKAVLDLLDGTRRLGVPILLANLPAWAPTGAGTLPLLLQGGRYTFEDGQWTLDLTTASAAAQGVSLTWTQLPPYRWDQFAPPVAWLDLVGVAA